MKESTGRKTVTSRGTISQKGVTKGGRVLEKRRAFFRTEEMIQNKNKEALSNIASLKKDLLGRSEDLSGELQ